MQVLAIVAGLAATAAAAAVSVESRQEAAKCPYWGLGFGGSLLLGPTDAQASRCCVYGESLELCCRNDPALASDPYWGRALECTSPYWTDLSLHGYLYLCNVDPRYICNPERCEGVPYLYDDKPTCS